MIKETKISFNHSEIEILFPFYIELDETLKIISAGKSLKKLIPGVVDSEFKIQFEFKRPFSVLYSFDSIQEYCNQVVILVSKNVQDILFRGQMMLLSTNRLVFLGSPWLTNPEDLQKFNLNIPDFAIHDSTTDMLQLINNKEIMSKDILSLVEGLRKQKREIEKSGDELKFSNKRFSALIQSMQSGILLENREREIVLVNKIFCELFGIQASPEQLIGYDCRKSAEESKHHFKNPQLFTKRVKSILAKKQLVQNEELELVNGGFLERDFVPIFSDNDYNGHLWIYRDITERKKNEIELVFAKEQAIVEKKSKEQFLANMSHELRNPINIITGITGLLADTNLNGKQNEYLGIIKTASENLLFLVNDILDFEKIQAKKIKFQLVPFDLLKIVHEVYDSMKYLAQNKSLKLILETDSFLMRHHVSGDPFRLKQILFNLVNNAIKFTEVGSISIKISIEQNSSMIKFIKIEIKDTGIGISKEHLPMIFSRYSQVNSESTKFTAGTGLGLTIVKNLVELQNGTIKVESKEGKGTSFLVSLPYEIIERVEQPTAILKLNPIDLKTKKILIVEDDKFNQLITTAMLEKHGANTQTADNGEIAIEKLKNEQFDLILMDLQMPVLNGYKTVEHIRKNKNEKNSQTPIIALTANILNGEKEKCIAIGMNEYLSKPFHELDLLEKIDSLLKRSTDSGASVIDLAYLKSVASENSEFYEKLITEFLTQTPKIIDKLKEELTNNEWANLSASAHKLKGSVSFIGTPIFIKLAAEIEANSKKMQHLNLLPGMIADLEYSCNLAYAELKLELKN